MSAELKREEVLSFRSEVSTQLKAVSVVYLDRKQISLSNGNEEIRSQV